jgi:hypothetical protein
MHLTFVTLNSADMMKYIFSFSMFLSLTHSAFAQVNKYTPKIEYCSCRFRIDSNFVKSIPSPKIKTYFSQPLDKIDSSFKTRCGYLLVPENREKTHSNTVKLPFIIVESKNLHKKRTRFYLRPADQEAVSLDGPPS